MTTSRLHLAPSLRCGGLLAIALVLSMPCAHAQQSGSQRQHIGIQMVIGSGKMQTEARHVSGFSAVAVHGSMTLVLRQGPREAAQVRADDNLLALIETRVVDRAGTPTLEIGTKSGASYTTRADITVTVDLIALQALSVSGSGDAICDALKTPKLTLVVSGSGRVKLRQFNAEALSVTLSGSGDADVAGRSAKLGLVISGSGDLRATDLEAQDVSVDITGSGDAHLNARKTLVVSIAGSGNVTHVGDAFVKASLSGSGTVKKR